MIRLLLFKSGAGKHFCTGIDLVDAQQLFGVSTKNNNNNDSNSNNNNNDRLSNHPMDPASVALKLRETLQGYQGMQPLSYTLER